MKYTPKSHLEMVVNNLLGIEIWEPSSKLLQTLKRDLPPEARKNRYLIRQKLRELTELQALGHETKLMRKMDSVSEKIRKPTQKEWRELFEAFDIWWEELRQGRHQDSLGDFVISWMSHLNIVTLCETNSIYP